MSIIEAETWIEINTGPKPLMFSVSPKEQLPVQLVNVIGVVGLNNYAKPKLYFILAPGD
jgi:hypothetical protein